MLGGFGQRPLRSDQVRIPGREMLLTQSQAGPLLSEGVTMAVEEGEVVLKVLPDVGDDQRLGVGDALGDFGIRVVQPHMTAGYALRRGVAMEYDGLQAVQRQSLVHPVSVGAEVRDEVRCLAAQTGVSCGVGHIVSATFHFLRSGEVTCIIHINPIKSRHHRVSI